MIDNGLKRRNPNSGVRRPILSSRLHGLAKLAPIGVQAARRVALEGVIETDGGPSTGTACDDWAERCQTRLCATFCANSAASTRFRTCSFCRILVM